MTRTMLAVLAAVPLLAQDDLTLQEAVRIALRRHPALEAAAARTRAAGSRVRLARSGYLPRVNFTESWARSDNPVFVFSSLLSQHQFTESNFRIAPLNRPDFLNNFQSQVAVDHTLYDWGGRSAEVRTAELGRAMSAESERAAGTAVIARVVRSYYAAVLSQASLMAAREALKSAEADAQRAKHVRQAGMSTDADVLSIAVHLAAVRESEIRRGYDVRIAIAALNEALGLPLDTAHRLPSELAPAPLPTDSPSPYESAAAANRPELRHSEQAAEIAEQQIKAVKAARLPQVGVRAAFEANRQDFVRRGGANWLVAASVRWNVFDGSAHRARSSETRALLEAAGAHRREVEQSVRLDVFRAWADAKAAEERIAVAAAAVAQAEESLRIIKNRFESGLANVTDLLRNETALFDARIRRLTAVHDQRLAAASLEAAAGTLSADSETLK